MKKIKIFLKKFYFMLLKDGFARAKFLKKHNVLEHIGENVYFYTRIFPSDPKLLKIHNNVVIATNVRFVFHDRIDILMTGLLRKKYTKKFDCIEVMDNVFIGADSIILPGVKIGENTIIAAGAVITHDLPPGKIWGGVPAGEIGEFNKFIEKRKKPRRPTRNPEKLWKKFEDEHKVGGSKK